MFILLLCAAILLISSANTPSYRSVIQLGAIVFFMLALMVSSRYLLCSYVYYILTDDADDDRIRFCVVKVQGKRETRVCLIGLNNASRPVHASKNGTIPDELRKISYKKAEIFNFCTGMFPDDAYFIEFKEPDGKQLFIKIQADTEFAAALNNAIDCKEE